MPSHDSTAIIARMNREEAIVRRLHEYLSTQGMSIPKVDDGEDEVDTPTIEDVIKVMQSVDVSYLLVHKDGEYIGSAMLVMGNDEDLIGDWGGSLEFSEAMEMFA